MIRKRVQYVPLGDLILGDLKIVGGGALIAILLAFLESCREALLNPAGLPFAQNLLLNTLAALGFLLPLLFFMVVADCLRPTSSPFLRRVLGLLLWGLYLTLAFLASSQPVAQKFFWSDDSRMWSNQLESAFAGAILLAGAVVISYRFIVSSRSAFGGLFRIVLLVACVWGLNSWQSFFRVGINTTSEPEDTEFVFVFEQLKFADVNHYFTQDGTTSLRTFVHEFRPLVMTGDHLAGQWATLLLGKMPLEHGLRKGSDLTTWPLVQAEIKQQIGIWSNARLMHWTNVTHPSSTMRMLNRLVPSVISGTRCDWKTTESGADVDPWLDKLNRIIAPLYPRSWVRILEPRALCLPAGVSIDEIVHEELFGAWTSDQGTGKSSNRLLSVWSLDLRGFESEESHLESGDSPDEATTSSDNLGLWFQAFFRNLEILRRTGPVTIHVVGLTNDVQIPGVYLRIKPGAPATSPWPLSDENVFLGLNELGARFSRSFSDSDSAQSVKSSPEELNSSLQDAAESMNADEHWRGIIYREWATTYSQESASIRSSALGMGRQIECTVKLGPDSLPASLKVSLEPLMGRERWEFLPAAPFLTGPPDTFEGCGKRIHRTLNWLASEDIGLFEPYKRDWSKADPVALIGPEPIREAP